MNRFLALFGLRRIPKLPKQPTWADKYALVSPNAIGYKIHGGQRIAFTDGGPTDGLVTDK